MSSQKIEFHKTYTRMSRSPWKESDLSRVAMLFDSDSKAGIYLHLGDKGINGMSVSKLLHHKLPNKLQQQYIDAELVDVVMYVFHAEIENYCRESVDENAFRRIFLLSQDAFFSDSSLYRWQEAFDNFMEQCCN